VCSDRLRPTPDTASACTLEKTPRLDERLATPPAAAELSTSARPRAAPRTECLCTPAPLHEHRLRPPAIPAPREPSPCRPPPSVAPPPLAQPSTAPQPLQS